MARDLEKAFQIPQDGISLDDQHGIFNADSDPISTDFGTYPQGSLAFFGQKLYRVVDRILGNQLKRGSVIRDGKNTRVLISGITDYSDEDTVEYNNTATSNASGVATFSLVDNLGNALFSTAFVQIQATAVRNTTSAVAVPFCSINTISADRKTVTVNVATGVTLPLLITAILGGPTTAFASGVQVYLYAKGY